MLIVTNAQVLHETQLVETFNIRAAIEYQLKNCTLIQTSKHVHIIYFNAAIMMAVPQSMQHRMH